VVELELVLHGGHEPAAKEVAQVVDGVFALEGLFELGRRPDVEFVQLSCRAAGREER